MKKSKLTLGLVATFIGALGLTACDKTVTEDSSNIVNFTGYGSETLAVNIDSIYNEWKTSSSAISSYYDKMLEVLIRNAFSKSDTYGYDFGVSYSDIETQAINSVDGDKRTANANADANKTNFATEFDAILSSKGVKDEKELKEKYIYDKEKETIENWYLDENLETLKKEYLGVDKNGTSTAGTNSKARYPYHIRHLLVESAQSADKNKFVTETISAEKAEQLANAVIALAENKSTFGDIAGNSNFNDDGSNTSGGDVGIVEGYTSSATAEAFGMVNEFQLGIYAYDYLTDNGNDITAQSTIRDSLGITPNETNIESFGIEEVPYDVFLELKECAKLETNTKGSKVGSGSSKTFPRNVLFNKYLNKHNIFVITNAARSELTTNVEASYKYVTSQENALAYSNDILTAAAGSSAYSYGTTQDAKLFDGEKHDGTYKVVTTQFSSSNTTKTGFREVENLKGNQSARRVLTDEKGNVIIGVRSEYGIHLMVIERSIFDVTAVANEMANIEDYYTTYKPSDNEYPDLDSSIPTYVNYAYTSDKNTYQTRADKVKSSIKSFDETYDYRLYEKLLKDITNKSEIDSSKNEMITEVNDYIQEQRDEHKYNSDLGTVNIWKTYFELLGVQKEMRSVGVSADAYNRLVPEGAKMAYYLDTYTEATWKEGGSCYYED